jgi:hypothetical protein
MTDVRHSHTVGQEVASPALPEEIRTLLAAIRELAFDAAAPRGERRHSRHHLRRTLKTRLRTLEARLIEALHPPEPAPAASADITAS